MTVDIRSLTGGALDAVLDDVARLRIEVFRDWPYLYDGDPEYERGYIATYRDSADAIVVGALDGARLVGAATGTPMEDHGAQFGAAFEASGFDLADIFYCAESVLLRDYRGSGIGHAFFDAREAHARKLGRRYSAFCRVVRPDTHPLHPGRYRPLDGFWRKGDTALWRVSRPNMSGRISATTCRRRNRWNSGCASSDPRARQERTIR